MIDKIKDIGHIVTERINDAFISSFILSIVITNSRGLLIFIYSDKPTKIEILNNWKLNETYDLALPLLMAVLYTSLIPYLGSIYKQKVINWVYRKVHAAETEKRLIIERDHAKVIFAQAEYSPEYVKNELDKWIKQKQETLERLNTQETEINNYKETIKNLDNANSSQVYYSAICDRYSSSLNTMSREIEKLNSELPNPLLAKARGGKVDHTEINKKIIKELGACIKNVFDINNSKPTTTFGEWQPPLSEEAISEFLKNYERLENDATELREHHSPKTNNERI